LRIVWEITEDDVNRVKSIVDRQKDSPFVLDRIRRNLAVAKPAITRLRFWQELVSCLLTTQQRSGPSSPVTRFIYSGLQMDATFFPGSATVSVAFFAGGTPAPPGRTQMKIAIYLIISLVIRSLSRSAGHKGVRIPNDLAVWWHTSSRDSGGPNWREPDQS